MAKGRDRLFIDKEDRKLYDRLGNEGLFKHYSKREQFLFAMTIGFKNGVKIPLESKDGLFRITDLHPEEMALINTIAINVSEKEYEVLSNREEVFTIVEEYAHAGIKILIDKIEALPFGSYEKQLEKELFSTFKELNIEKK